MIKTSELIWQDTQHQVLFQLIDEIQVEPFDRSVIFRLQTYAEHHFSIEEAYMDLLDFPGREEHVMAHNRFREELAEMVAGQISINRSLQKSLSQFLSEWLRLHVLGIDKKLEAFILESNAK